MKKIFIIILLFNFTYASYSLKYSGIKLGSIKTFNTINENYFTVKITNSIVRFFIGRKYMIFYNNDYLIKKNEDKYAYKIDKHKI